MSWSEFSTLLAGLNYKTPLGQIISIRSENDRDILKTFTPEQRKIRNDWRTKSAKNMIKNNPDYARKRVAEFQAAMKAAFYDGNKKGR